MSDSLFDVSGQVVLVSGASRGIGRALAAAFADRGAQVVITGREAATLERAAGEISTSDRPVLPIVCDVARADSIEPMVAAVITRYGRIDTLINVAGVNRRKKAENFSEADYDFVLDINLKGPFLLSTAVGRRMIERKSGNQINIASLNNSRPLKGVLPYAISKSGMGSMTQGLALEWGPHGIRVNAIAPGFIITDMNRQMWSEPAMQAWGKANTPLGRVGGCDDLVGAAIFLASRASAFLTGQVIYVDGGITCGTAWPLPLA